jgi:tetratricopeptide (TPR) repeat protein
MEKVGVLGSLVLLAAALAGIPAAAQPPAVSPIPEPSVAPLTAELPDARSRREQAYVKLFEGQRHMWKLQRMQTQAGRANSRQLAKAALEAAVALDPTLAEGYTALAQLAVAVQPRDIDEGIRQGEQAVKADRQNVGGHRILARLYTVKSRLNSGSLDQTFGERARAEWREVARLDPRNAEAWAFLSAFAEARNQPAEQIDALRKWVSAAPPSDVGFYEGTMGGASLSPEFANLKLASTLAKAGKTSEAATLLSGLVADDPENSEAVVLLGDVVDAIEGSSADAVVTALRQAVYSSPDNVSLIDMLARLQSRLGQFDDAVTLLKHHTALLAKSDIRAASTLAVSTAELFLQRDRYDDAVKALENALTIRRIGTAAPVKNDDREFVQYVFEKLIHIGKLADRPQAVRASIERARKVLGKDDLFADRLMVMFLESQGGRQEALTLVRSLRVNRPDDTRLLRLEASLLTDIGQVDAAVELIKKKTAAKPSTPITGGDGVSGPIPVPVPATDEFSDLLFISNLYTRAKRGKDAIDAANRAIGIAAGAERRQIAKVTLATGQQMSGDTAAAEQTLREVLKETPGNPMALNNLGYFLVERGERLEEAVELIKQALKVDPKNPSYLDSLGWAYFKLDKMTEAEKYLADAARADADSATIYEHLGDVYRRRNDLTRAKSLWERALRLSWETAEIERLKKKLGR